MNGVYVRGVGPWPPTRGNDVIIPLLYSLIVQILTAFYKYCVSPRHRGPNSLLFLFVACSTRLLDKKRFYLKQLDYVRFDTEIKKKELKMIRPFIIFFYLLC